jgi:ADP-ribose pyrophosphatase
MLELQKPEIVSVEQVFPANEGPNTYGKTMVKEVIQFPNISEPEDFYHWHSKGVASIVFVLTEGNEVVAIRLYSRAAHEYLLQCPGGSPRSGESFEDAAFREVFEETGYRGNKLIPIGKGWFEPINLTTPYKAFLMLGCKKEGEPKQGTTELLQVEIYQWEQWWQMCVDGEIQDSKSVTLTMRASKYITA